MLPAAYEQWARGAAPAFRDAGAAEGAALDFARLYVALWGYGLNPRITSLFRDPVHQQELRDRWDRGDRAGLRARPADPRTSLHCQVAGIFRRPAARAIDIVTDNDTMAARVASSLDMGAGQYFRDPDPGHFYSLRAA